MDLTPRHAIAACAGAALLASCGRVGFDSRASDAVTDGATPGDGNASVCASPRLVGHWRLDDTTGAVVVDATGNHDGMWRDAGNGLVSDEARAGHSGGALAFDAGSYVYVPGFVIPAEGTFSAWLTSTFDDSVAFSGSHPILFDAPTPRTTVSYDSDMGVYGLRTNDVSWQASFTPQADFTGWFHLTATWSALGAKLYLDGVAIGTPATGDARSTSPAGLYLGTREQADRQWGGLIDDVRFYDYAMTPSEVAALVACP